ACRDRTPALRRGVLAVAPRNTLRAGRARVALRARLTLRAGRARLTLRAGHARLTPWPLWALRSRRADWSDVAFDTVDASDDRGTTWPLGATRAGRAVAPVTRWPRHRVPPTGTSVATRFAATRAPPHRRRWEARAVAARTGRPRRA